MMTGRRGRHPRVAKDRDTMLAVTDVVRAEREVNVRKLRDTPVALSLPLVLSIALGPCPVAAQDADAGAVMISRLEALNLEQQEFMER